MLVCLKPGLTEHSHPKSPLDQCRRAQSESGLALHGPHRSRWGTTHTPSMSPSGESVALM